MVKALCLFGGNCDAFFRCRPHNQSCSLNSFSLKKYDRIRVQMVIGGAISLCGSFLMHKDDQIG